MDERQRDAKVRNFFFTLSSLLPFAALKPSPPPHSTFHSGFLYFLAMKVYQEPKIAAKYTENAINSYATVKSLLNLPRVPFLPLG